jgi:hypothetical protein
MNIEDDPKAMGAREEMKGQAHMAVDAEESSALYERETMLSLQWEHYSG